MTIVGKSQQKGCPKLVFHRAAESNEILDIAPHSAMDDEAMEDEAMEDDDSLYKLGNWPLSELVDAYKHVHMTNAEYDIVTNNCASFVLDMMCHLKIPVTPQILDWTVSRLVSTDYSTDRILQGLVKSAHLADLPMMWSTRTLEENKKGAVAELVYYYAATHEDLCFANN